MIRRLTAAAGSLLAEVRMYFGLSQAELAALLGLRRPQVAQAEAGTRTLSSAGWPRLRALQAAQLAPAAALPIPDLSPLHQRRAQCQAQAQQMQLRLTYELPARAAAARARLGAVAALPAALASAEATDPLPPRTREDQFAQLTLLLNGARAEWDERSGPAPAALLRARHAGLLAEAEALAVALAALEAEPGEATTYFEVEQLPVFPPRLPQSLSPIPDTYSLAALDTQAACAAALLPLRLRRDEAAAEVSATTFALQAFAAPATRQAEITRLNTRLAAVQAELPTLPEGKEKRKTENEMAGLLRRRNRLLSQNQTRSGDDKVVLEFQREMARQTQAQASALVAAIEAHQATLPH